MPKAILFALLLWATGQDPDEWVLAGCGNFNWAKLDPSGKIFNRYATRADEKRGEMLRKQWLKESNYERIWFEDVPPDPNKPRK
jgi:hypothetical protein